MLSRERTVLVLTAVLNTAACTSHHFVSPTVEQGPAPFLGPPRPAQATSDDAGVAPSAQPTTASAALVTPQPISFFKTQDSNEWVARTFKVQTSYTRVIAVSPDGKAPPTLTVGKLDLNGPPGQEVPMEVPVSMTLKTLADAALMANGGDLIAVLPGRYKGFILREKADAGDDRYVHIKALGPPGAVVIDAPGEDSHWMILLSGAHHVILQGLQVAGAETPGDMNARGPMAGILLDGDFVRTSSMSHHIAVVGNFSHHHTDWGIHSVDTHTVLVQDNLFAHSAKEHAAYFSDGSDNYVIRRNVFFGSYASGLQINVDPLASLQKLLRHRAIGYTPLQPTSEWALGLLRLATEKFGTNAFPDGRGFNYIIEDNVMNGNGRRGGGALNLAGVRESLIQNNLMYDNASAGIAEWDNANPFDQSRVNPGPKVVADVTGAEVLPIFGCFNNLIRNNTILSAVRGRAALIVGNGSWGTRALNNVLVNDEFPSIELLNTSIWRFEGNRNVLDRVNYEGPAAGLKPLALALPDGAHSVVGIKRNALAQHFVRANNEPWVVFEGNWWKLNPKRPDFRPRPGSALFAGKGDAKNTPTTDLEGRPRVKADIGAYAAAPQ